MAMIATATKHEPKQQQTARLAVRGQGPWVAWIDRTARQTARTRSSLFEAALLAFAKTEGLTTPPPRV
jgi:hypothetical protein